MLKDPIQVIGPASLVGNSRETFHKSGTDGSNPVPSSGESLQTCGSSRVFGMANAWSTASLAPWPPPGITPLTLSTTSGLSPGRRPESRCRGSPQCGFGEGSADRRSVPAAFARGAGRIVPARGPRLLAFDRGCAQRGYRLSDQVFPLFAEFKQSLVTSCAALLRWSEGC